MKYVNIIGLILVTIGAIGAGICAPGPSYQKDGSVQIGPELRQLRVQKHYMQKYGFPLSLWFVGIGSALQLMVAICS